MKQNSKQWIYRIIVGLVILISSFTVIFTAMYFTTGMANSFRTCPSAFSNSAKSTSVANQKVINSVTKNSSSSSDDKYFKDLNNQICAKNVTYLKSNADRYGNNLFVNQLSALSVIISIIFSGALIVLLITIKRKWANELTPLKGKARYLSFSILIIYTLIMIGSFTFKAPAPFWDKGKCSTSNAFAKDNASNECVADARFQLYMASYFVLVTGGIVIFYFPKRKKVN